jgi:hypothetical protein
VSLAGSGEGVDGPGLPEALGPTSVAAEPIVAGDVRYTRTPRLREADSRQRGFGSIVLLPGNGLASLAFVRGGRAVSAQ